MKNLAKLVILFTYFLSISSRFHRIDQHKTVHEDEVFAASTSPSLVGDAKKKVSFGKVQVLQS